MTHFDGYTSGPSGENANIQSLSQSSNEVENPFEEEISTLCSLGTDPSHGSMGKLAQENTEKAFGTPSAKCLSSNAMAMTLHKQQKVIIETMVRK